MKHKSLLFVALCLTLCLIPSVGMLFFPTTQTTENKAMAAAPVLVTEEGKVVLIDFEMLEAAPMDMVLDVWQRMLIHPFTYANEDDTAETLEVELFDELCTGCTSDN